MESVVRARILLKRIEDWEGVGEVRPATTVMQIVSFTDPEWLVEIEGDAISPERE